MSLDDQGLWAGVVAAILAIGGGITAWQRQRSSAGVERAEDSAKVGMISRLQEEITAERARADQLFDELQAMGDQRTADARVIERQGVELEHMRQECTSLRRNLRRMAEGLAPELRAAWEQALETDFTPLDDRPGKPS